MAVETAEDLDAFFDPDAFGEEMVAHVGGEPVPFVGIPTTGQVHEQTSTMTAQASMIQPRILAKREDLEALEVDHEIERQDGTRVKVIDLGYKGDLVIISYQDGDVY